MEPSLNQQSKKSAVEVSLDLEIDKFHLQADFQARAEVIVLFGPSGSGKSTLLRTIAGLVTPKKGVIRLGDSILYDAEQGVNLSPNSRRVGYVPQNYALFPHLTVMDNIAFGLHKLTESDRNKRVDELLKLMQIRELANRKPAQLSGGQQQRVALARALAPEPAILLMDEPLAALDENLRQVLRAELRSIPEQFNIPLLLVTHHPGEAYSLAGQLVILHQGYMLQAGSREEIFRHPKTPTVAKIVGMSNILDVELIDKPNTTGKNTLWQGIPLTVPTPPPGTRKFKIGIRPEEILIVREKRLRNQRLGENIIPVRITSDDDMGLDHRMILLVETDSDTKPTLEVRISHPIFLRLQLAVGQRRRIAIRPASIHVFCPN